MPTNLTGTTVAATYSQLLHVDDGPTATEKIVYSATGVATALSVGTGSASVDNIRVDGNTISSTNLNGDITLAPNGSGSVGIAQAGITGGSISDTAVTGGTITGSSVSGGSISGAAISGGTISGVSISGLTQLDVDNVRLDGNTVSSTNTDGDLNLEPNGAGQVVAKGKVGYGTGSGGTVTQLTSRTTGVTLNQLSGQITLFSAQIAGHEADEFVLTNSFIDATDVVVVNMSSSAAVDKKFYTLTVTDVSAGSCTISVGNNDNLTHPASGAEGPTLTFMVLKAANA
jgi:hypothetical protein